MSDVLRTTESLVDIARSARLAGRSLSSLSAEKRNAILLASG